MTSTYALHLKLDILLNDQPQLTYSDNRAVWDFEPERRLIWIDQDRSEHICEIPPVTLPLDYRPRTICGCDVATTRLRLVDADEWPLPSCRSCYEVHLRRLHGFPVGPMIERTSKRIRMRSLAVSLFVAILLLAPSFDDLSPGVEVEGHELAQGPSLDDSDTPPADQDM